MYWLWQAGRAASRSNGADRAAAALRGLASAAHAAGAGVDAGTGARTDVPTERASGHTRAYSVWLSPPTRPVLGRRRRGA